MPHVVGVASPYDAADGSLLHFWRDGVERIAAVSLNPSSGWAVVVEQDAAVAFAAGPWATWESAPAGRRAITLYARRARAAEVDADSLIGANRDALEWLEEYFGIPYPFAKLDMLLAPAFPFGGMEHPGAIFYNESRFVFREPPTWSDRLGRDATIYHEVAHQWFGDLVTMRWFDDLWLKEGFSTYVAARMQDELDPGSEAWKTFYLRNKPLAYATDQTSGTTPVWQELPNLDLAKSNYGPIVYNKAPAILKQLNHLVGEEAFRAGLGDLLREHAYANMTWRDLLWMLWAVTCGFVISLLVVLLLLAVVTIPIWWYGVGPLMRARAWVDRLDAELAAGHPVNADVFRQRSREWRQQQADYASLEARNHSLSQALDRARSALQPAA